jgi:hypothetical protein
VTRSGVAERAPELTKEIMMAIVFAPHDIDRLDREYGSWLDTFTEASARLDVLQTAVTEIRCLCESGGVSGEQILQLLDRQGV